MSRAVVSRAVMSRAVMSRAVMSRAVVSRAVMRRGAGSERLNADTNQGLRFLAIAQGVDELVETVRTALAPPLRNVERWGERPSRGKSARWGFLGVALMSQEPSTPAQCPTSTAKRPVCRYASSF
jgi:hypothetical protein